MTTRVFSFILCGMLYSFFSPCFGQILALNQPLFTDDPFFNQSFIKANKIKSITGSISSKKVRDIIRSKGLDFHYEFNKKGKLIQQISSHLSSGIKDSTTVLYYYDEQNNIETKRKNDSYGFYAYHYSYDDQNQLISQTYCREENIFNSKYQFKLKSQFIISKDSFSYEKYDASQSKKKFYNVHGRLFKEQTNYFNEYGYLTEEYTKFIIGNNKKKTTYFYDENGRLSTKEIYINIAQDKKTTSKYTYDEIGNVLEIKEFKDGEQITSRQFLYDQKTMLLTAQIIQDVSTGFLRIIQYRYEFHNSTTTISELKKHLRE